MLGGCRILIVRELFDAERVGRLLAVAEELLAKALNRVESLGSPAEVLRDLARFSVRRDT